MHEIAEKPVIQAYGGIHSGVDRLTWIAVATRMTVASCRFSELARVGRCQLKRNGTSSIPSPARKLELFSGKTPLLDLDKV